MFPLSYGNWFNNKFQFNNLRCRYFKYSSEMKRIYAKQYMDQCYRCYKDLTFSWGKPEKRKQIYF